MQVRGRAASLCSSEALIDVFFKTKRKELKPIGSLGRLTGDWCRAVELMGIPRLDAKFIITHRFGLPEFKRAFEVV